MLKKLALMAILLWNALGIFANDGKQKVEFIEGTVIAYNYLDSLSGSFYFIAKRKSFAERLPVEAG